LIPNGGGVVTEKAPVLKDKAVRMAGPGRKLLQRGGGEMSTNFDFAQQNAMTDTAGAISAAASGQSSAASAAAVGSASAYASNPMVNDDY